MPGDDDWPLEGWHDLLEVARNLSAQWRHTYPDVGDRVHKIQSRMQAALNKLDC